jgi:phage shock protein A
LQDQVTKLKIEVKAASDFKENSEKEAKELKEKITNLGNNYR